MMVAPIAAESPPEDAAVNASMERSGCLSELNDTKHDYDRLLQAYRVSYGERHWFLAGKNEMVYITG